MSRHVFIAIPTHDGNVRAELAHALTNTAVTLLQNGITYTLSFLIGDALVHDARNRLVAQFMTTPATDLLFIDADIAWNAEDALRLAISPHDVIGGVYRRKVDHEVIYNQAGMKPTGTTLIELDYIATGFLKISRKAIEKMIEAHPDKKYTGTAGEECYGLFEAPIEGGKITGEDALFCRRWRALGGKVLCDPNMTLHHIGAKAYSGNFGQMIAAAQKGAA